MCDFGATAAVIGVILTAASTALGTTASVQSSNAQKAQYEYQAEQQRHNAKIAENNATSARQKGVEDARLARMKTLAQIGELKTANAANGIDINTGTALDTIEDTATMGELDAMNAQYQGNMTANNYNMQADNFRTQSYLNSLSAKNTSSTGTMNAFGTALAGMGDTAQKVAGVWYEFKKRGQNEVKVSAENLKHFV